MSNKLVHIVIAESDDPYWDVVGVTSTLEDAQIMALEYLDDENAYISVDDPRRIIGGVHEADIYSRYMEEPSNGF